MTEEVYLNLIANLEQDDDMGEPREPTVPQSDTRHTGRDSEPPSSNVWEPGPLTNWPTRNPLREATRYPHWLPRASSQRGAYPPSSQERESPRQRRPRFHRFNHVHAAESSDGDPTSPIRSSLQQASTMMPSTRPEISDRPGALADAQGDNTGAEFGDYAHSPESASLNRLRPW